MTEQTETLGVALPKEMDRVREVLGHYREIGPVGVFAVTFIEHDLRQAEEAIMFGDTVQMLRSLATLRAIED